jgi:hypothetical protein
VHLTLLPDLSPLAPQHDILLMADVLYDRSNLPLLGLAGRYATEVLVADSRLAALPDPAYRQIAVLEALTVPNLGEFDEFATTRLFYRAASPKEARTISSAESLR